MWWYYILYGQGGILGNAVLNSPQYKLAWFMEIFAYCAVDIFALISGYVSYTGQEKKIKIKRYLDIWLQVVFYGLVVTFLFNIFKPELVTKNDYFAALFPVTNGLYWYFTAYTGLFVLMPLINKGIYYCDSAILKKLFVVIFLVFSIFEIFSCNFILNGGYSFIWIVLLYILGAIIKKCEIGNKIKSYQAFLGIIVLTIITYLWRIYEIEDLQKVFVSYISPTILGSAILYVIAFSKLKFRKISIKIIEFFAPATFAVYLLNNQKFVWEDIMANMFINIANSSLLKIFVYVVGFSVACMILSMIVEKIRVLLFKSCFIFKLTDKLDYLLDKIITKIAKII